VTDLAPVEEPQEFRDEAVSENYYGGGGTLIQISFSKATNDPSVKSAVKEIQRLIESYDTAITGAQQIELEEVMSRDQIRFALVSLVLVTVVLLLTIPSIVVPVLFVITIGSAVAINLGLSYYLGQKLSYITGVVVFALQFAVTMDYALFLYHRFEEERQNRDVADAMTVAIATTFKSVTAAAVTTVAGFLALTVMHLQFGMDMGLTLARGVAITLVLVVMLLPSLLLEALPLIDKVRHKVPRFDFSKLGRFVAKHAGVVSIIGVLLFVPAVIGNARINLTYNLNSSLPADLPSMKGNTVIGEAFGRKESVFVVLEDTGSAVDLERLQASLEAVDGVTRVFGYSSLVDPRIPIEFVPAQARESFFANGYTYLGVDVAYGLDDPALAPTLDAIRRTAAATWPAESYVTGRPVLMNDMEQVSVGDADRINIISIVAILIIVALAFRSLSVPVALVGIIQLAILLNLAWESLRGNNLIFVASLAIGAIQLGATVDYAILITTRYEEELIRTRDRVKSITVAVAESSQSILVSAMTMFAATIPLAVLSSVGIISDLTLLIARGALISLVIVIVLLPAVLVVGQPIFERTSIGWPKHAVKGD